MCKHAMANFISIYDALMQALELDRRNVDAWVARGAAYANQHAFPKAISDFQTALGVLFNLV